MRKKKKSHLDLVLEDIKKYNEEHGTALSYGEYKAYAAIGKIDEPKHDGARERDIRRRKATLNGLLEDW